MSELSDALRLDNHLLWTLIGVSVAMVFTLQAVQAAIEGAWPHERRPARLLPQERAAQPIWGVVALSLLFGGIVLIVNLGILLWKDLEHTEAQVIGGALLGICWLLFLLVSADWLHFRSYLASIGAIAPLAILIVLIVANVLLTIAMFDILPSWDELTDALPFLIATGAFVRHV